MSVEYERSLVSVIVPTYNREHLLKRALESVFDQSYRPIELIVVDDGSTDGTREFLGNWGKDRSDDKAFRVVELAQANGGAPVARNLGLIHSRGEYIQYLDSDDILHPEKVSRQIDHLIRLNCDYVYSAMAVIPHDEMMHLGRTWEILPGKSPTHFAAEDGLEVADSAGAGIYRRNCCLQIGPWDRELECYQDFDYRYRFESLKPRIGFTSGVMYLQRTHGGIHVSRNYNSIAGLISLLQVMKRAELLQRTKGVDLGLYGRYFRAMELALILGHREGLLAAVSGAARNARSESQRLRMHCFKMISAVTGLRLGAKVLKAYKARVHS